MRVGLVAFVDAMVCVTLVFESLVCVDLNDECYVEC